MGSFDFGNWPKEIQIVKISGNLKNFHNFEA
jgi:hypothetical protein